MRKYIPFLIVVALAAGVLFSCKRDYPVHSGYSGVAGYAFLKVVHASPNFRKIFNKPDSLNVFVGGIKVNGAALQYNTQFPTTTNSYFTVQSGSQTIKLSVNGVTTSDSITVLTLQKTMNAGSYYTLVITDSIQSTRDSSQIWTQDAFPKPSLGPGYTYLRFVHAVMDDSAGTTVSLYSPRRNQTFFSKVKIDSITPFVAFPSILGSLDTLYVIKTNTGGIVAKFLPQGPLGDQRYYTAYYMGDTALAPAAKARTISLTQNK